jgi:hypothetical protein
MTRKRRTVPPEKWRLSHMRKLLVLIVLLLSFSSVCAWWNVGYDKRKSITIDNTGNTNPLTNYQVFLTVSYDADMSYNFNDLRFIDSDDVTQLNYYVEEKVDNTYAYVWVKIPSIPASSTKTIYMYYAKPLAASGSNGDNTFQLFDNFTSFVNGTRWNLYSYNMAIGLNKCGFMETAPPGYYYFEPSPLTTVGRLWCSQTKNYAIIMNSTSQFSPSSALVVHSKIVNKTVTHGSTEVGFGAPQGYIVAPWTPEAAGLNSYGANRTVTATSGNSVFNNTNMMFQDYHRYEMKWNTSAVEFWYDFGLVNATVVNVPSINLPIGIRVSTESSGGSDAEAPFEIDLSYLFVRNYSQPEPVLTTGSEQNITSYAGCTNELIYTFNKTVSVSGELVNLDFTNLTSSGYVRNDLYDVFIDEFEDKVWTNFTGGNYIVVNVTGVSSINVMFGNYLAVNAYENHTKSDNTTDMSTYSVLKPHYLVSFMNEKTMTSYIPEANRTLTLYCSGGETSFATNYTKILFPVTSQLDEMKEHIRHGDDDSYYRNLLVTTTNISKDFYLIDTSLYDAIKMTITLQDITGTFDNSELIVKKNINNVLATITELNFDAENKAIIYLIDGDKYTLTVNNGVEERSVGYLYADSDSLSKTLVLGFVNYTDLTPGKFLLNLTFGSIEMTWNDPSNNTINVSVSVYNKTTNELMYSGFSTADYAYFSFDVPDENATYKVIYEIHHETLGSWSAVIFMSGDGAKTIPTDFIFTTLITGLGGTSSVWIALLLLAPFPFMFSKRFAMVGIISMIAFAGILVYWEVYTVDTSVVFPVLGLIGFLGLFIVYFKERDNT